MRMPSNFFMAHSCRSPQQADHTLVLHWIWRDDFVSEKVDQWITQLDTPTELQPLTGEDYPLLSTNTTNDASLDVSFGEEYMRGPTLM